jgi:hypothetical protein
MFTQLEILKETLGKTATLQELQFEESEDYLRKSND